MASDEKNRPQLVAGVALYGPLHGTTFIGPLRDREYEFDGRRNLYRSYEISIGGELRSFWVHAQAGDPVHWDVWHQQRAWALAEKAEELGEKYLRPFDMERLADQMHDESFWRAGMHGLL